VRILTAILVIFMCFSALALEPDSTPTYAGIDVSEFQGEMDFDRVKNDGIQFVYIRSSIGTQEDTRFTENAENAISAGLDVGFYHFVEERSAEEAAEEARFFWSLISDKEWTLRPVMDFERFKGQSRDDVNEIALAFMNEIESLSGVTPMLYTDAYAADALWEDDMGIYPLWVADWDAKTPRVTSEIWDAWTGFQYTDAGRVVGMSGNVDRDNFSKNAYAAEKPATKYAHYTVRTGDTLSAIANEFSTALSTLAKINAIADINKIYVGQSLKLPLNDSFTIYTAKEGDTLWELAQKYITTVEMIADLNQIKDISSIRAGQILYIH